MRHFTVLFALVLLGLALPTAAQTNTDPAAYLPGNIPLYFEVQVDETGLDRLRSLLQAFARFSSGPPQGDLLNLLVFEALPDEALPGIESVEDIVSWTAGRVGVGGYSSLVTDPMEPSGSDVVIVLPIADADGAHAFVETLTGGEDLVTSEDSGVILQALSTTVTLMVSDNAIWIGTTAAIEQIASAPLATQSISPNPLTEKQFSSPSTRASVFELA